MLVFVKRHTPFLKFPDKQISWEKVSGLASPNFTDESGSRSGPVLTAIRGIVRFMTDAALGWCAGLFDGEGCISIHRQSGTGTYHLMLRMNMTDESTVRRFRSRIGLGTVRQYPSRGIRVPSYIWGCYARREMTTFLCMLLPYLVTKRRDAQVALRFLSESDVAHHPKFWAAMRKNKTRRRSS